jgi:lysophospholipase L1-like esterase
MKIRHFAVAAALILGLGTSAYAKDNWLGAWAFVPVPPPPGAVMPGNALPLSPLGETAQPVSPVAPLIENPGNVPVVALGSDPANVTIRQLARVSVAGKRIRLRVSNESSPELLALGAVHVGIAAPDGGVVAGTDRVVTFSRHKSVLVPASAPLLSDPIDLPVKALDRLAISFYVPGSVPRTGHTLMHYLAGETGDHTGAAQLPHQQLARVTALATEVDVDAASATGAVVALGDSITDGATSTINAFRSWPDRLAERLGGRMAVVNTGIGGNRLLRYGTGPNALARLDRDVLAVPGAKAIILLEGINDIGRGFQSTGVRDPMTAEALIAADRQIIQRAHDHGIKVIGATLTPYQGAGYASPEGEQARQALNNWIKTGGEFDGVVDFAAATGDAANPLAFRQGFNIADHLHPNDAGYQAMADSINLSLLK